MDITTFLPILRDTGLLGLTFWLLYDNRQQQKRRDEDTKEERIRTLAVLDKYGEALQALKLTIDRLALAQEQIGTELRRMSERNSKS